ncbi:hypothetical protein NS355_06950 [Sphingomonas yabuuchiae]|uniref:O-antigen ligase-related domain-containing protein n=1 Tax=Sphingomonas yabuuchiae TaxID=172044 RepID=A0A147IUQ0_9SPHN|nr:O-antigen ligase family protein [Sphingomonas yabuuchiae]KTT99333.1 hypothetical protein NS355_06950 [Sphingomonas yabuuchiae]
MTAKRGSRKIIDISLDQLRYWLLVGAFVLLILVSATQIKSIPPSATEYTAQFGAGNALRQGLYSLCVGMVLIASRPVKIGWRLVAIPPTILLLLAFCVASIGWSDAPSVAVRRLILTVMIIWTVFRCVDELGYRRAMDYMVATLLVLLFINYAYVASTPAAIHQGGDATDPGLAGDWHGLIPHKNDTGPVLAETIILLAFGCGRLTMVWRLAMLLASGYFLYRTHSKTSLGLVFVGLATGLAYLRYRPAYRALLIPVLMLGGAVAAYAAITYVPMLLDSLDSSETAFTGRIQIWRTMTAYLREHWVFGAGFGSFWDAGPVSPANVYGRSWVSAMVSQGHNGYLDLWTQLGIFGLLLAVAVLFVIPGGRLLIATMPSKYHAAAAAALLIFLMGHNLTETTMMARDTFGNLMLAFAIAVIQNLARKSPTPGPRAFRVRNAAKGDRSTRNG